MHILRQGHRQASFDWYLGVQVLQEMRMLSTPLEPRHVSETQWTSNGYILDGWRRVRRLHTRCCGYEVDDQASARNC